MVDTGAAGDIVLGGTVPDPAGEGKGIEAVEAAAAGLGALGRCSSPHTVPGEHSHNRGTAEGKADTLPEQLQGEELIAGGPVSGTVEEEVWMGLELQHWH